MQFSCLVPKPAASRTVAADVLCDLHKKFWSLPQCKMPTAGRAEEHGWTLILLSVLSGLTGSAIQDWHPSTQIPLLLAVPRRGTAQQEQTPQLSQQDQARGKAKLHTSNLHLSPTMQTWGYFFECVFCKENAKCFLMYIFIKVFIFTALPCWIHLAKNFTHLNWAQPVLRRARFVHRPRCLNYAT